MLNTELSKAAEKAILMLEGAGFEAYAVGGCVRDSLLGKNPTDFDITTSAKPEEMKAVFKNEHLIENAAKMGKYFEEAFKGDKAIKEYRGKGLMIGMELNEEYVGLRDRLLFERHFFTGAAGANVIRLLPSLTVSQKTAESFVNAWKELTL